MDFLYLGPSVADYRKALELDIWFKSEVPGESKEQIMRLAPYPLVLNRWYGSVLHCASDDLFSQRARAGYGNPLKRMMAKFGGMHTLANPIGVARFHQRLDASLAAMNETHPIFFLLKPGSDLYDDQDSNVDEQYSELHRDSATRMETEIVPALTRYFLDGQGSTEERAHAAWVAEGLFEYVPAKISRECAQKLIQLAQALQGHDLRVDERLRKVLAALQDRVV